MGVEQWKESQLAGADSNLLGCLPFPMDDILLVPRFPIFIVQDMPLCMSHVTRALDPLQPHAIAPQVEPGTSNLEVVGAASHHVENLEVFLARSQSLARQIISQSTRTRLV
jgi:hypothetical protein